MDIHKIIVLLCRAPVIITLIISLVYFIGALRYSNKLHVAICNKLFNESIIVTN